MGWVSHPGPQDAPLTPAPPVPFPADQTPATAADTQSVVAFVLGIFSVFGIWLLGPVAIYVANGALRRIDAGEVAPGSRTLAVVARVLGIIGTVLLVLGVLAVVVFVLVVVRAQPSDSP